MIGRLLCWLGFHPFEASRFLWWLVCPRCGLHRDAIALGRRDFYDKPITRHQWISQTTEEKSEDRGGER